MIDITVSDFRNIVSNIKNEIKTTQVKTMQQANTNLIMTYYRIGKILDEKIL